MGVRVTKKPSRKALNEDEQRIDELEKEVRELKAINRSLMKQLKKLSKGINRLEFEQALERLEDEQEIGKKIPSNKQQKKCPDCGNIGLRETEIAGRRFASCECGYRSGRIK